jgi:hypothetical protein
LLLLSVLHLLLRRFIKNNLLVELTSSKYASAFAWLLRRHTIMAYSMYMAGRPLGVVYGQ